VTAEKAQIVRENAGSYGLNTTLAAIELPKSTWYYWKSSKVDYEEKYRHLRGPLVDVLNENPMYGYRRVEPELKARGHQVGEIVIQRVLGMWDLSLRRRVTKPRPSAPRKLLQGKANGMNLVAGMEEPEPLQVLYTDFTEIWYARGGKKAYLMPLLDHGTKWVVGWSVGHRPNTELALEALSMTQAALDDVGLALEGRIIHHDQDSVYTGYRWLRAVLIKHRARISYSENGAKGNTTMESFFGRFKTENQSLFHEAMNIWELKRVIAQQIDYYNRRRRHSTCLRANTHRQALGNTALMDYVNKEVILPEPALGLALRST